MYWVFSFSNWFSCAFAWKIINSDLGYERVTWTLRNERRPFRYSYHKNCKKMYHQTKSKQENLSSFLCHINTLYFVEKKKNTPYTTTEIKTVTKFQQLDMFFCSSVFRASQTRSYHFGRQLTREPLRKFWRKI